MKLKVAIIIPSYYPLIGGAEVFAQNLAEHLVKAGHEVDIITMRGDSSLSKLEAINGVTVHRIILGRIRYISYVAGYFRLLKYLLRADGIKKYDLIHAVGDGLPSIVATTVKKIRRKPAVITIQGGSLSAGFEDSLAGKIARKLQRWSFKNAELVHVISHSLARTARDVGAENVAVIPNGIDSEIFRPMNSKETLRKRHDLPLNERLVISVARLHPVKGINHLIKAAALLADEMSALRLIVVGEGEQRQELEVLIHQLGLENRVQLPGLLSHQQIAEYLNMADVFVLPSIHEGLGIALLEAMACGVPSIGSGVGGIVDIIENERNGILVPPGDAPALRAAIRRLLEDNELRGKFKEEGLKKIKEGFLWDAVLPRFDKVYANLVQN